MEISKEQLKELRDMTGVSVMQCKKALEEAGGDMEKAVMLLRKKSSAAAAKKADRTLGSGIVQSYIHPNNKVGVLVELQCETDFVAQNEDFIKLANDIAMHIAAMSPEFVAKDSIDEVMQKKVEDLMKEEVAELDKPDEIKAKILEGKIKDYFAEKTLLDQSFVREPEVTIGQLVEQATQKLGEKIAVGKFTRYAISA